MWPVLLPLDIKFVEICRCLPSYSTIDTVLPSEERRILLFRTPFIRNLFRPFLEPRVRGDTQGYEDLVGGLCLIFVVWWSVLRMSCAVLMSDCIRTCLSRQYSSPSYSPPPYSRCSPPLLLTLVSPASVATLAVSCLISLACCVCVTVLAAPFSFVVMVIMMIKMMMAASGKVLAARTERGVQIAVKMVDKSDLSPVRCQNNPNCRCVLSFTRLVEHVLQPHLWPSSFCQR